MANIEQSHFRFGADDGTEITHTFWQLEDVDHTQLITADWTFLLRFCEQVTTAVSNVDAQFQYNKNGAGWVNITTSSVVVKAVAVGAFTNGQVCTKRLSGTGTFETSGAGCTEDGSSGGTTNDIVLNGNSETEAGLQVVNADVANNDTIQFRLTSPDGTMVYTRTPTLTIQKVVYEYGAAILSGIGTLAGLACRTRRGLSTLAGAGALASICTRIRTGISVLTGAGSLVGIGQRLRQGLVTLSGSGLVACIGTIVSGAIEYGAATLSGIGSLAGKAITIFSGKATLTGAGTLVGIGAKLARGLATLTGAGSLSGIPNRIRRGITTLAGQGNLVAKGVVLVFVTGKAILSGIGNLVVIGSFYRILRLVEGSFMSDLDLSEGEIRDDLNLSKGSFEYILDLSEGSIEHG